VAGLIDAYRARHPEGLDHSRLGSSGVGCRIDHIFVIRQHTIQIRGCGYLQVPRRQGLTDHAAMTLTLALASGCDRCAPVSVHHWYNRQPSGVSRLPVIGYPARYAPWGQVSSWPVYR